MDIIDYADMVKRGLTQRDIQREAGMTSHEFIKFLVRQGIKVKLDSPEEREIERKVKEEWIKEHRNELMIETIAEEMYMTTGEIRDVLNRSDVHESKRGIDQSKKYKEIKKRMNEMPNSYRKRDLAIELAHEKLNELESIVIETYYKGTFKDIKDNYGWSQRRVSNLLKACGMPLKNDVYGDEDERKVSRMLLSGMSTREIQKETGYTQAEVLNTRSKLKEEGLI